MLMCDKVVLIDLYKRKEITISNIEDKTNVVKFVYQR